MIDAVLWMCLTVFQGSSNFLLVILSCIGHGQRNNNVKIRFRYFPTKSISDNLKSGHSFRIFIAQTLKLESPDVRITLTWGRCFCPIGRWVTLKINRAYRQFESQHCWTPVGVHEEKLHSSLLRYTGHNVFCCVFTQIWKPSEAIYYKLFDSDDTAPVKRAARCSERMKRVMNLWNEMFDFRKQASRDVNTDKLNSNLLLQANFLKKNPNNYKK